MRYSIKHIAIFVLTVIALLVSVHSNAQQSNTFYLLHDVPQSNLLNPAVQIKCKWFVGIPGLSSTHLSYSNTAFTYEDLTEGNTWNLENVERQMHRVDLYGAELSLQALAIGHRHKSFYFNFSINEKAHLYQTVPGNMASMAVNGNGPFIGEEARFNPFRPFGIYVREYAFGTSKVINRTITAGVRAKLLFGKAGISSGQSSMRVYTGENRFDLLAEGAYELNSSLPLTVEEDAEGHITGITVNEINYAQFLLNRGNPGIALDLGIIYRYNEKLSLSASLLDIGILRWRTDLNSISAEGSIVYEGIRAGVDVVSLGFLEEIIDSLQNAFNTSVSQNPYTSLLPMQLYLGGSYLLKEHLSIGVVNRNLLFRSKLHSSITLSATADLKKHVLATLSWSYLNKSIRNLGGAIAWHGKGFQFHLVSDNLLGFLQPFDTRTINLRVGCNFMFGCPRNKKEELEAASYGSSNLGGVCYWTSKQKQRTKRYRKSSGL